jgi:hypothetical protein
VPLQLAVEEQRNPPPILLKLMLLALIVAGLPPLTETEALLVEYSQVVPPQVNFPPAPLIVIVPLPPLLIEQSFVAEAVPAPIMAIAAIAPMTSRPNIFPQQAKAAA